MIRRKKRNLEHIASFLDKALRRKKIHIALKDQELIDCWCKAVGPLISAHTYPERLNMDTLYVRVSSSTWMHQLHFMKQEIIDKVNALLDKRSANKIHFFIGNIPADRNSSSENNSLPVYELRNRDKRIIRNSLENITDIELKTILERLMTKEIWNRRRNEG